MLLIVEKEFDKYTHSKIITQGSSYKKHHFSKFLPLVLYILIYLFIGFHT